VDLVRDALAGVDGALHQALELHRGALSGEVDLALL
jgi:hypothetical protein